MFKRAAKAAWVWDGKRSCILHFRHVRNRADDRVDQICEKAEWNSAGLNHRLKLAERCPFCYHAIVSLVGSCLPSKDNVGMLQHLGVFFSVRSVLIFSAPFSWDVFAAGTYDK